MEKELNDIKSTLAGELLTDNPTRLMYATDASAYREIPLAVAYPRSKEDIKKLIIFAGKDRLSLIPRGAGTSLAGQVVGNGIVVDISRYLNNILEFNISGKWVRVEPGIVLDELNLKLKSSHLFFAPETSTSNRCVIGGMIGNNSSGLRSLIYGTTREHLLSVKGFLSDGSEVEFGELDQREFAHKCKLDTLEGNIYRRINSLLQDSNKLTEIDKEYPDKRIIRRNTGYALDELSDCSLFRKESDKKFNFCNLIAGSEGTLFFITEAKLNLVPLPPPLKALVCVHLSTVKEAIRGNLLALSERPAAVELMDKNILDCTLGNIEQRRNRFFIQGDPGAILIVEFQAETIKDIHERARSMEKKMRDSGLGYYFPLITGDDIKKVWELRKAGLGVLSNLPGDAKPVSVIEDTSVHPEVLENYIDEFNKILAKYNLDCVYHAHISVGELHLRPVLNLKDKNDRIIFRQIAEDTAKLVKKYKGSLSGEHGDGRLRGQFIPLYYSGKICNWFIEIKDTWDPYKVFNESKIVRSLPMDSFLRYESGQVTREKDTVFDFSDSEGMIRAVEKCNGSGDCRKTELMGGTMCPSYMATRDESTTTRARANILREYLSYSDKDRFIGQKEVYQILDLCLSCKACKSECPSSVDMAKLKSEFLQHYYDKNSVPLRTRLIANYTRLNKAGSFFPSTFNFLANNSFTAALIKSFAGFSLKRSLPLLHNITFEKWLRLNLTALNGQLKENAPDVYLFLDEFTNYNDTPLGIKTVMLLNKLGYRIRIKDNTESARTFISKGLLRTAKRKAMINIRIFEGLVTERTPLVGIEPSAILAFRDEYPDLLRGGEKEKAMSVAKNSFTIEEFLAKEIDSGRITRDAFISNPKHIKFHGHCQQKALTGTSASIKILSFPENFTVEEIKSGCCGMAGSFGYEKEHYDLSMKVGELVLFPTVRKAGKDCIISASGTSCRHQIKDGTGKTALHPVEILFDALKE